MSPAPNLPEKVIDYSLRDWDEIRTSRPKLREADPDVPRPGGHREGR
jgi:hypothetical protein